MRSYALIALLSFVLLYIAAAALIYIAGMHALADGAIVGSSTTISYFAQWLLVALWNGLPALFIGAVALPAVFYANKWLCQQAAESLQQMVNALCFIAALAIASVLVGWASFNFYVGDVIYHWGPRWADHDVFIFAARQHTEWWITLAALATALIKYLHHYLTQRHANHA